ncbi:serine/threonine-protein kinase [Paraburkholderia graminis]|uniref:serine/threonine-protein kinase n=1 Tax=Paraburkholderia graminis TaxID=60548 RepID=UPI0038BB8AE3
MNDIYSRLGAGGARARQLFLLIEARARRLFARRAAPVSSSSVYRREQVALDARPADAGDGLTVVQPAVGASSRASWDDATVVKPASRSVSHAGSQEVQSNDANNSDVNDSDVNGSSASDSKSSDSSLNRDTWQRVAQARSGDHASVGKLLKGRFLLERELGRGGMGVVYLARDERKVEARDRDPYVAVKVLNDEFRRHPDSLIALQREARRAQRLAHDNIVHVYDFDKDGTIVFMTMEYIDGTDLRTLIRERPLGMPFREAWPLIDAMARALQRAHASGIVHSDFKPGNVMVTRDGVPKVFDFGIARAGLAAAGAAGEQTVFDAGTLGAMTPAYASLDMIEGAAPSVRDDVYALGCVVFELLTGRHPFDRHSADVALRESAVTPPVPGLGRRQYRALCQAVAFRGGERLQTVGALVEALRPRKMRERLLPYCAGALAVAVLAAGASAWHSQHRHRQLEATIARFADSDPRHYANEDQAVAALALLGVDERERLVLNQNDLIQRFLASRLDAYWSPPLGRIDYAAAQHVFQIRDQLKLFSPEFDVRRKQIDDERADMLAKLASSLDEALDRDALFDDQPGSAADILQRIRMLDPGSALLKSPQIESRYDAAIGQSLDSARFDEARARIALALQLFPDSSRLQRRRGQLAAAAASATQNHGTPAAAMSVPDARRSLVELAANPSASASWLDGVSRAMTALQNDASPETGTAIDALADGIVAAASRVTDPLLAHRTLDVIEVGLRYAPHSPGLSAQRDRMLQLLQQQRIDQLTASGDAAAQMDALRLAAAANDGARALAALNRMRALEPGNAFLTSGAPQLVANAYLGNARALGRAGHLQDAARVASQGADALSGDQKLGDAAQRYLLAAAILAARDQPMADPDLQALQARFDTAQAADPEAMKQMERDIGASIALPPGGLSALLEQIKARVESGDAASAAASVSMTLPARSDRHSQANA